MEAGRERDLARQLSSLYEILVRTGAAERQPVPRNLERVQLDPDGSGGLHAGVIVNASAQRDQRDLATFYLERGRRLFDREQDGEALAELRRAVYLVTIRSAGPPADWPDLSAGRKGRRRGGRAEDLHLERRYGPGARRARRGVLEDGRHASGAHGSGARFGDGSTSAEARRMLGEIR